MRVIDAGCDFGGESRVAELGGDFYKSVLGREG